MKVWVFTVVLRADGSRPRAIVSLRPVRGEGFRRDIGLDRWTRQIDFVWPWVFTVLPRVITATARVFAGDLWVFRRFGKL